MTRHIIEVLGCDDYTTVPMELTEAEVAVIQRLADMVKAAESSRCKPVITVDDAGISWDVAVKRYQEDVAEKQEQERENAS